MELFLYLIFSNDYDLNQKEKIKACFKNLNFNYLWQNMVNFQYDDEVC